MTPRQSGSGAGTIVDACRSQAERTPSASPYLFLSGDAGEPSGAEPRETAISFHELDARVRGVAAALQRRGAAGRCVLVLSPPGPEFVAAFFGSLYAGAIAVPCYPPDPGRLAATLPRLRTIAAETKAALALAVADMMPLVDVAAAQAPEFTEIAWLATDGDECRDPVGWRPASGGPDDLAFLQYTSGSTRSPRGVMVSHRNVLSNIRVIDECLMREPGDRGALWLPPYHDMGLISIIFSMVTGFQCVWMSPLDFIQKPLGWLQAISRYRVTHSGGPNFAYELCVRKVTDSARAELDLSSWAFAFCGAEPIRASTLERFANAFAASGFCPAAFYPWYGLGEATLAVAGGVKGAGPPVDRLSAGALARGEAITAQPGDVALSVVGCGGAKSGHQILIVDSESRTELPERRIGEIWYCGPSVTRGYWRREEDTRQTFGAHLSHGGAGPFLRTGDLGYVRAGVLYVTGRRKDMIIVGGLNFYPQDIEQTVESADGAIRPGGVAAFSLAGEQAEQVVVVCEIGDPAAASGAIIRSIRRTVARTYGIELAAVALTAPRTIPKTSSGKVRRSACREIYTSSQLEPLAAWRGPVGRLSAPLPGRGAAALPSAVEQWVVSRLALILGIGEADVDPDQAISDLGADSRDAVELTEDLAVWLGTALPPTLCWDTPSIGQIARHVALDPVTGSRPVDAAGGAQAGAGSRIELASLLGEVEAMDDADVAAELRRGTEPGG